jgi:hypothetical protein
LVRSLLLGIAALFLASGCAHVQRIHVPESQGEWVSEPKNVTKQRPKKSGRMYTRRKESKYVIKPEPYSLASKKKDPELLGPQRTYSGNAAQKATQKSTKRKRASSMTKESCISLIGQTKYNTYVQKYGGEKGALRRCMILKRLRG